MCAFFSSSRGPLVGLILLGMLGGTSLPSSSFPEEWLLVEKLCFSSSSQVILRLSLLFKKGVTECSPTRPRVDTDGPGTGLRAFVAEI